MENVDQPSTENNVIGKRGPIQIYAMNEGFNRIS